jgi:hypothetical protein
MNLTPFYQKLTTAQIVNEVRIFIEYVNSFYNIETGIDPIATEKEITDAVYEYLFTTENQIDFDSMDRECVRMILQPSYSMF